MIIHETAHQSAYNVTFPSVIFHTSYKKKMNVDGSWLEKTVNDTNALFVTKYLNNDDISLKRELLFATGMLKSGLVTLGHSSKPVKYVKLTVRLSKVIKRTTPTYRLNS